MSNLASTVLNKQNIISPGKKKLLLQYQPRGQVSTFSKLFAEQVFYRFTGKKAPQMQIISYTKAGRSPPNINNWFTELERKQNIKSSISTECICEFTARGECFMQSEVTEDFDGLLLSGQRKHPEENHRQLIQTPNTQLHRHSTCSENKGHGIHPSFYF